MLSDNNKNLFDSDGQEYDEVFAFISEEDASSGNVHGSAEYEVEVVELDSEFEVEVVEVTLKPGSPEVFEDRGNYPKLVEKEVAAGGYSVDFSEPVLEIVSEEDDTELDDELLVGAGKLEAEDKIFRSSAKGKKEDNSLFKKFKADPLGSAVILLFLIFVILFIVYLVKILP